MEISFNNPVYLWFLFSIPLLILAHFYSLRYSKKKALTFANFPAIEKITGDRLFTKNITLLTIRALILFLVIMSVSGAVFWYQGISSKQDFVIAIDASSSMLATDYDPNRISAAKEAALLFVDRVPKKTKIGVISFAGTSFIEQYLTEDSKKVKEAINSISIKRMGGTDLGEAVVTSVNLLLPQEQAKAVILLTDGQSNVGQILGEAIDYAVKNHVITHTIGVGTEEGGQFFEEIVSKLDEKTLIEIAEATSGEYYRALDRPALARAFKDIALLTRKQLSINLVLPFLVIAILLLFTEWVLINTRFKQLP